MTCPKCNTPLSYLTPATSGSPNHKSYVCRQCEHRRDIYVPSNASSNDIIVDMPARAKTGASE